MLALALAASGCFRWAPAESLADIQDDRVQIHRGNAIETLEHATASGREVSGVVVDGEMRGETDRFDATDGRLYVRRLDGAATAAVVTGSVVATAGTVVLVILAMIASASHNVQLDSF